jgi:cysteine desulfurase / selenocysteine lyase
MSLDNLADLFPIKRKYAYFMSSSSGPLSLPAYEAIQEMSQGSMNNGALYYSDWLKLEPDVRELASKLLGCHSNNVAFVNSTSHGLWIASQMLDWQPGDEVILPRGEFPANVYPWLALERLGVQIRWLDAGVQRGSAVDVTSDSVRSLVNSRTRLLSVSFVQFDNGCQRDIKRLGQLCQELGIKFVVDAIQGLGVIPLNSTDCLADFVVSGCQKWLLSPHGVGLLYAKSSWLEIPKVPSLAFYSLAEPYNFAMQDYEQTLQRLSPRAQRFEASAPNVLALAALKANLELMLSIGIEEISKRIKHLSDRLVSGLTALGFPVLSPRQENLWSGIVSAECPGMDAVALKNELAANGIIIGGKADTIRVAVHFFNDESDIDRLLNMLRRLSHLEK